MSDSKDLGDSRLDKVANLESQEKQLSSLCNEYRDGIILHDLNGDVLEANPVALEMLGYSKEDILSCNFKDLQPSSKRGSDKSVIALEMYNDSRVDISRTVFVRKSGSRFPADVKTSYVRFKDKGSFVTVVQRVFRDIETTALRVKGPESGTEISPLLDERVSFINILSKELTSPLSDMLAAVKLLTDTNMTNEQRSLLSITMRSGDFLISMISDVMDFFKIGNDLLEVQTYRFNLMAVIGDVIEVMTPIAEKKNCEFSSFIDSEIPEYVVGDEARIRQILLKLLSNAIYLTDDGHIKLEIHRTVDGRIRFEVMDSGGGIDEEDQQHLFSDNPFNKQIISRKYSDVALGYVLSRKLVTLMGGDVGFSSMLGKGALFWFSLDLEAEKQSDEDMVKYRFLKDQDIVYMDCVGKSRDQLQRQLKSWGATLHVFGNEPSAIEFCSSLAIDQVKPSLIILNAHNDDVSYAALVREINEYLHRDDNLSSTNFVVITPGISTPHTARHFARVKHTHVKHPLRIGALANKLARLVCMEEPYPIEAQHGRNEVASGENSEERDALPLKGRILIVDDGKVTQMATSAILGKRGFTVDCASNGWEAINAIERNSYDVVLMDVQMPEMDGIEATKRIRKMEMYRKRTPILAITANMEDGVWRECVYAGMDDYMTKPIESLVMVATIQYWMGTNSVSDPFDILGGRQNQKQEVAEEVTPDEPGEGNGPEVDTQEENSSELMRLIKSGKVIDLETIHQMEKDTSEEITAEMVELFIQETEHYVDFLVKAINEDEFEPIAKAAHTMISASGTFGATWLQNLATMLEKEAQRSCKEKCDELVAELPAIFEFSRDQLGIQKSV